MKLSWGFVASSLYCTASAVRPTVSPDTARLIIAQRLGLSRFHSIEHADAERIRQINAYGGRPQKLFGGDDAARSKAHLLVWIDADKHADAQVIVSDGEDRQEFALSSAPSASENDRLFQDLILQAESLPTFPDPQQRTYTSGFEIESVLPSNEVARHNEYLNVWRTSVSDGPSSEAVSEKLARVFHKAAKDDFSVTVVMTPASASHSKRSANVWGTYSMPSNEARGQNPEAVLSAKTAPSTSPNPHVSDLEDFPVIMQADAKGPVRGILPVCFNTLASCQTRTHNCSSHGECKLLHKGRGSGSNQETVDCYGCACVPTVKQFDEDKGMESKKHVTYWGGPACQKRDISVQFWLFVFSGVVLAFLVSSGIGMLYTMGSEELPSVIGAGVSGPVRK